MAGAWPASSLSLKRLVGSISTTRRVQKAGPSVVVGKKKGRSFVLADEDVNKLRELINA
jgi:hypothetical protein